MLLKLKIISLKNISTELYFGDRNFHDDLAYVAHNSIDLLHKSHIAPISNPTMHHFDRNVHITVTKWCIVGYLMHCDICEMGQLLWQVLNTA